MADQGSGGFPPVVSAEVLEVALPLRQPFVTGFGSTTSRRTVLVHVEDAAGHHGWGEAAALDHPFYLPETAASCFVVALEFCLPLALETSGDPQEVATALTKVRGNCFARSGVEAAFWTLRSAASGRPVRSLVGGSRDRVEVGESIGIQPSVRATVEEAEARLREGYRRIKLKIRPGWDVEVVAGVRAALGSGVMLQVDANASYTLADADRLLALDSFGLACIEQPLGWDDLLDHVQLQRRLQTPVCLDESLRSVADVRRALDLGACRNVNLKPGRVGGIAASLQVHELCRERGVPLWCGGMLESGIGRAANLALCSLPGFTEPADMSPAALLFDYDLVEPTYQVAADGTVAVPTMAGLGFPVCDDRLERTLIRRAGPPRPGGR